jgi:hypothetical protein
MLRFIPADARREFRIPHSYRLNRISSEAPPELLRRWTFQQRDTARPCQTNDFFFGPRAVILCYHHQADFSALECFSHPAGPDYDLAGSNAQSEEAEPTRIDHPAGDASGAAPASPLA